MDETTLNHQDEMKSDENVVKKPPAQSQPVSSENPSNKKMSKPLLISIIAVAIAIIAAVAVLIYMNLPSTIYMKAKKCLLSGDYNNAITYFTEVIAYEDAEVRIQDAYLGAGMELVKEKNYASAVEMLEKVTDSTRCADAYLLAGQQLVADKRYSEAVEMLDNVMDPERCSGVYFLAGQQLIADEQYTEAVEILEKSTEEGTTDYVKYANAILSVEAGEYDSAITAFADLGEFEDSVALLNSTYYAKAEELYVEGSYTNAKNIYNKTTGYDDVAQKVQNCDLMAAEELFRDGELKKAKEAFEKLPSDLTFNDVSVSARLATLKEHAEAVSMCGTFKGSGNMTVRQTHDSTGIWDQWDCEYVDYLTLKVVINADGTYTYKGTAKYYIYTNYSSLSAYLKSTEMTETFTQTGTSLPKELTSNSLVKMTYSNGKIKLDFTLKDANSSVNFTYKYTSSITYTLS